jgi:hypothetical protein
MKFSVIVFLSLQIFSVGCSRPKDGSSVVIKLGVRDDGQPFFDWEGTLMFKTGSSGLVHWESGAKARASFSQPSWKSSLEVDLVVKDSDEDRYSVTGTVTSPVPIRLELLGTGASEKEPDSALSFPAGRSDVKFKSKLHSTYAKKG